MSNTLKKHIDKYINKAVKKTAAISAAIVENNQVIYRNYSGVIDGEHTPNSDSKMMMIGSNTKLITAIAIFQLYEQGLVDLDCDISKYINNLNIESRFKSKTITIRDLLMHRSGLISDEYDYFTSTNKTSKDLIDVVNDNQLSNEPGTLYSYSNIGYGLLGYIIEQISKMDYISYVQKHILDPLKMGVIFIKTEKEREKYNNQFSKSFSNDLKLAQENLISIYAAGANAYGTLDDLIKLIKVFINPKDQSVLKEETILRMLTKPIIENVLDGEMMHGLGLIFNMYNYDCKDIGNVISHGGDTKYHHSRFVFIPKLNSGFIVMTNTLNGFAISGQVVEKLMQEFIKYKKIKLKLIAVPSSKRIEEKLDSSNIGIYSGLNISFLVEKDQDNHMIAKVRIFKLRLHKREDGFYETQPLGIAKLPIFSGSLKRLLFSFSKVNGSKVLCAKEYRKYTYNSAKIGMKYNDINNVDEFNNYTGKYLPYNKDNSRNNLIDSLAFEVKDKKIILRIKMWGIDNVFYLSNIDNELYVQGFGRHTGDKLEITDSNSFKLFGLNFIKE